MASGQATRYFEFTTNCGHGKWQDTSFIAATTDQAVISRVLANLAKPLNQRNFISGKIDYGHGGHNRNAGHWFLWHFVPDEWDLVELAIELCDGCPYSDVDADTAYWVGTVGSYCPWSGRPVREVSGESTSTDNDPGFVPLLYPNPAQHTIYLSACNSLYVTVYHVTGKERLRAKLTTQHAAINLTVLENGVYLFYITDGKHTVVRKVIINR